MKGILLTGGLGNRLKPVTKIINKHALPVYNKPMFYWPLQTLISSGIGEIAVVSGPPLGKQIKTLLKYFQSEGVYIKFFEQKKPLGIPNAIYTCRNFIRNNKVIVIAGDNIYMDSYEDKIKTFKFGALSFLRKVNDPERYAVPIYKKNLLVDIREKPKKTSTNWVVTGPHIFDEKVADLIKRLELSPRGEYEIADLNKLYLQNNKLELVRRKGKWFDVGTFNSLTEAASYLKKVTV